MKKEIRITSPLEMMALGEAIGKLCKKNDLIALEGDLGAGKTTLTKGIAKGLGIEGVINSPTFTIMKIHEGPIPLYHMDVYRIEAIRDDFELEEYFEADGVCVVEWASRIASLLPKDALWMTLLDLGENQRRVILESENPNFFSLIEKVIK